MQNRTLVGILCLCLGVFVFSIQDVFIKAVSGGYPVTEAIAIRAMVSMPIMIAMVHYEAGLRALLSPRIRFLLLRAAIMFLSYMSYYLAIAALPLADAIALYFIAPLTIVTLSVPYLGERIHWTSALAVLVGLAGVLVMLRPGSGLFEWAALLSLSSAVTYSLSQLMARKVGDSETATVMSFYQNAVYLGGSLTVAALFTVVDVGETIHPSLQFLTRAWAWPTPVDFLMMAACGIIASAGTILLTQAYRLAPANRVAAFEYTGILWAPMWGYVVFAEVPHAATWLGGALIVGAGLVALNAGSKPMPARLGKLPDPA